MKKIILALIVSLAAAFAFSATVLAEEKLTITTDRYLGMGGIGLYYEKYIEISGGTAPYTFYFDPELSRYVPAGLTIEAREVDDGNGGTKWVGVLSGEIGGAASSYSNILIYVSDSSTDEEGKPAPQTASKSFSMVVQSFSINYEVKETTFTYDGLPHEIEVFPYFEIDNNGDPIELEYTEDEEGNRQYKITNIYEQTVDFNFRAGYVSGASNINAGSPGIEVVTMTSGYTTGDLTHNGLNINSVEIRKNNNVDVSIDFENTDLVYDGTAKEPTMSIIGHPREGVTEALSAGTDYTLRYFKDNQLLSSPPVEPGDYRVRCEVNSNYYREQTTVDFTIEKRKVSFKYSEGRYINYGYTPTLEADAEELLLSHGGYSVTYTGATDSSLTYTHTYSRNGNSTPILNAGAYSFSAAIPDSDHFYWDNVSPGVLVVAQLPVNFKINDGQTAVFQHDKTVHNVTIEPSVVGFTGYTADYYLVDDATQVFSQLIDAGEYKTRITITDNNYVLGDIDQDVIVILEKLVFTAGSDSEEYDGTQKSANVSCPGYEEGKHYTVTYTNISDSSKVYTTPNLPIDAGTYSVEVKLIASATGEYQIDDDGQPGNFTIEQKSIDFTVSPARKVYNGTDRRAEFTVTTPSEPGFTAYTHRFQDGEPEVKNTGTYEADIQITDPNYKIGTVTNDTVEIYAKTKLNFSIDGSSSVTYDGAAHSPSIVCTTDRSFTGYSVSFKRSDNRDVDAADMKEADTYKIEIALTDSSGADYEYELGTNIPTEFIISKKSVTFTLSGTSFTYEKGTDQKPSVSSNDIGAENYTVTYYKGTDTVDTAVVNEAVDAGTYTVSVELRNVESSNYTLNGAKQSFTIAKKALTFTADNTSFTYKKGTDQHPNINCSDESFGASNYTVSYYRGGNAVTETKNQGTYTFDVTIENDSADNYNLSFVPAAKAFTIAKKNLVFDVSPIAFGYDGESHLPVVTCTSDAAFTQDNGDFKVIYYEDSIDNEITEAIEYGTYGLSIVVQDEDIDNYTINDYPTEFSIAQRVITFTVGNTEFTYNGQEQTPTVECSDDDFDAYSVVYTKDGSPVDSPVDWGTYGLRVVPDDSSNAVTVDKQSFTINKKTVNFKAEAPADGYTYSSGLAQAPAVTAATEISDAEKERGYSDDTLSITYKNTKTNETSANKPVNAGEYEITEVAIPGDNYIAGTIEGGAFVINPKTVAFTVSNNEQVYSGSALSLGDSDITNNEGFTSDDYTVSYKQNGSIVSPVEAGKYTIVLEFKNADNQNNYAVSLSSDEFSIIGAQINLGLGNSVFAQIENSSRSTAQKEELKTAFTNDKSDSYRMYEGQKFSEKAWGENDLDADPTALIMYNNVKIVLPQVTAINSNNNAVEAKDITVKLFKNENDEEEIADLSNKTEFTPSFIEPGVYNLVYSFTDPNTTIGTKKAVRKVAVVWDLGDINQDLNVNNIDGAALDKLINSNELSLKDPVYLYRICDVNRDGVIDVKDVQAIYARRIEALTKFY